MTWAEIEPASLIFEHPNIALTTGMGVVVQLFKLVSDDDTIGVMEHMQAMFNFLPRAVKRVGAALSGIPRLGVAKPYTWVRYTMSEKQH